MNEKFNTNAKVEQLALVVLSHGEEKGLIVKDPLVGILYKTRQTILASSAISFPVSPPPPLSQG